MSAIAIMVAIILAVTLSLYSSATDSHQQTLKRLESLETGRAAATAKRWTADDQVEYIACMEYANFSPERRACVNRIKARLQATKQ